MNSNERVSLTRCGEIALLHIDNPPVNAVSSQVIDGLERSIDATERDPDVKALVLSCAGGTFVAGGDITAFDDPSFSAVYRPGDIGVVWTAGYGFPDHRGGPLFLADEIGLPRIVARLAHYATERGYSFGYWTPSKLLTELAADGRRITDWRAGS